MSIKKLLLTFCQQINFSSCSEKEIYLVDYSKSTNKLRGVEFHCSKPDINGLQIKNDNMLVGNFTTKTLERK